MSEKPEFAAPPRRHPEVLIAPLITLAAVIGLVALSPVYDRLPVQLPACNMKSLLGVPCPACGGTRSVRALVEGDVATALLMNPAVVIGGFVVVSWFILSWFRFRRGAAPLSVEEQNRVLKRNGLIALSLLAANWVYLILFLE